jgi:bacterioferritin-associated ferredoxin
MIVCSCNAISDLRIRDSVKSEKCPRTPGAVYRCLGCSPNCGRCYATVQSIIKEALGHAEAQTHRREGTLKRFKEEWATTQLDDQSAQETHELGACAAGCDGCTAARSSATLDQ